MEGLGRDVAVGWFAQSTLLHLSVFQLLSARPLFCGEELVVSAAIMKPPQTFETPRLLLRPPMRSDAQTIFSQYAQDAEVTKYLTWQPHRSLDDTADFYVGRLAAWEDESEFSWTINRKADQQLLGMIGMHLRGSMADIGYVIARSHWRQGVTAEAARVVVEWALAQPHIYRVRAFCDVENTASARVLEKIGMQREGLLRR